MTIVLLPTMRVRVTNFPTGLTTVDYPLVLITGCVENYPDQVGREGTDKTHLLSAVSI